MSPTRAGRYVGALILLAFGTYGGGTALISAATAASPGPGEAFVPDPSLAWGVLLVLLNSVVVASVGAIAFPVLRRYDEVAAVAYVVTRTVEAVVLALGALPLLLVAQAAGTETGAGAGLVELAVRANDNAYTVGMLALGLGSVVFCRALLHARLVPRGLAVWGIVGYAVVAAGMALDVVGLGIGMVVWVPGGVFEVALAVYLLVKGFRPQTSVASVAAPPARAAVPRR